MFRRKKLLSPTFEAANTPFGGVTPLESLTGDAFRSAAQRGVFPPAGWTFTNRFLFGNPTDWSKDVIAAFPLETTTIGMLKSLEHLVDTIVSFETAGASAPEWFAAEEAVTLHLTALTIALSGEVVNRNVPAMKEKWGSGRRLDAETGWLPGMDAGHWILCEIIRDRSKGIELAARFTRSGSDATDVFPSEVVAAVLDAILTAVKATESSIEAGPEALRS